MNDVYEYRRAPNPWVIRLSAIAVVLLMTFVIIADADHLLLVVWGLAAATYCWMMMPKSVLGIRIDRENLVLGAWRRPRAIRLDDIAYLRVTETSAEPAVTIVYKDGREEAMFAGDLPEIEVLSEVLAERGVPLRDIY